MGRLPPRRHPLRLPPLLPDPPPPPLPRPLPPGTAGIQTARITLPAMRPRPALATITSSASRAFRCYVCPSVSLLTRNLLRRGELCVLVSSCWVLLSLLLRISRYVDCGIAFALSLKDVSGSMECCSTLDFALLVASVGFRLVLISCCCSFSLFARRKSAHDSKEASKRMCLQAFLAFYVLDWQACCLC